MAFLEPLLGAVKALDHLLSKRPDNAVEYSRPVEGTGFSTAAVMARLKGRAWPANPAAPRETGSLFGSQPLGGRRKGIGDRADVQMANFEWLMADWCRIYRGKVPCEC
jgi:hypothetical protein